MTDRDRGSVDDTSDWLLLSVSAPPAGEAFLLVEALRGLGARSVEREGGRVAALFPPHPDPSRLAAEARLAVRASTSVATPDVTWRRLEPEAWATRLGLDRGPRRVTGRIVVETGPERTTDAAGDDDVVLRLAPSTAFGSWEHPTTRSCLRRLDGLVEGGERVLDVGAGSGILSIAAVLLGAHRADALEVDAVSCTAARRNVAQNALGRRVRVREVRLTPGSLGARRRYHGVLANLQAPILAPLIEDLARATRPGGWVVLSGVLPPERDAIVRAAESVGLRLETEDVDDGWWTGRLSR